MDKFIDERIQLLQYHKLFYLKDLQFFSIIGQGQFGLVYKGILKNNQIEYEVAIKTISKSKFLIKLIK